jgi:hypothetical protein
MSAAAEAARRGARLRGTGILQNFLSGIANVGRRPLIETQLGLIAASSRDARSALKACLDGYSHG